ncbi:MAG: MFS transporter, partial [Anaerolineae bacterium]|nr:MFS transporter [Anaerolineae bacterium]
MNRIWRRNLRVIWIAELLAIMGFSSSFPIWTYYIQELGVDENSVARWSGIIISSAAISMGIMGPVWGALSDKHGRKIMVMRAMFGGGLIIGLMGFAQSVQQLALLRLIQGVFTGTVAAATALVASDTSKDKLGSTLGKLQLAIFLGQAFGPTTGGFFADLWGYRATFWITSSYLFVAGLIILLFVQENFVPEASVGQTRLWDRLRMDFGLLFTGSMLTLVLGLRFALRIGLRMNSPILPLIVQELLPAGSLLGSATGLLSTISGASSAIAAPLLGRVADRSDGKHLLMLCAFSAAAGMVGEALAPTYGWLVITQVFMGVGIGGTLAIISAYIGRLAPEGRTGAVYGLDTAVVSLSSAVGPTLGGWLSDTITRRAPL